MNVIPPLSNQVQTELIINYEYPRKNNPIEDAALEHNDIIRYIQKIYQGILKFKTICSIELNLL